MYIGKLKLSNKITLALSYLTIREAYKNLSD